MIETLTPALLLALSSLSSPAPGEPVEGWLDWRGPLRNGVSLERELVETVAVDGEHHLWSYELSGRGTPVVADGRVYALGYRGEGAALREGIVCLDEATGALVWERWWSDFLSDVIYDRYAIGSPTVDPETGDVFLQTTSGVLMAMSRDGAPLWEHSLLEEFGRLSFPNGRTGAPVVDGSRVIVNVITAHWGKVEGPARTRFLAFDKRTGLHLWTATPGGPPKDSSFSHPILEWRDGRRVFYANGGGGFVFGVDARTGDTLWRYQVSTAGMNASPVIFGDTLIAVNGKENVDSSVIGRMLSLKLGAAPAEPGQPAIELTREDEVWRNDLVSFTSSPVLVGARVYQTVATGELCCVDAETGAVLWHQKLAPDQIHASPAWGDGKLYVPMNNGSFHILRPTDAGPEELCQVQLEGNCLGAPAICAGRIYVHTTARLYCFGRPGTFVDAPAEKAPVGGGRAVRLMLVPGDVLLMQGESVPFRVTGVDQRGGEVATAGRIFDWQIPPSLGLAVDETSGRLVAPNDAKCGVGAVKVSVGELSGTGRVRVVPRLPYLEDFDAIALQTPDPEREGAQLGGPPGFWIGARLKWDVRELGGTQVLAKTLDNPLFQRATTFFGHPEMRDYTARVDIMTDGNRRTMSSAGLVNQRYLIQLNGNYQELQVSSNDERLRAGTPYRWKAGTWYTLETRVDVAADGSGVVRAKVWERDAEEPDAWTLEVPVPHAHEKGSPGLFSFAPQSRFRVYLDNLSVVPNE